MNGEGFVTGRLICDLCLPLFLCRSVSCVSGGSFGPSLVLKYMGVGSHEGMWYYPIFVTVTAVLVVSKTSTRGDMRPVVFPL